MNYLDLMPPRCRLTGDRGVILVQSRTNLAKWHRVDLEEMKCDCESATKGKAFKAQKRDGMTWDNQCPHVGLALAAWALALLEIYRRNQKDK
jgi:hypothetical protein